MQTKTRISKFGPSVAIYTLLLILGAISFAGAAATSNANGALSITNLNISPQPVVSGENVIVTFNLYNSYSASLTNVDMALTASNPIINVSPSYSYITPAIGEGMFDGFINPFKFDLHIPSTLTEGLYVINVTVTYQTTQDGVDAAGTSVMPIFIYVNGNPGISVNVAPEGNITPGMPFNADITLVNHGSGTAYNTTLHIDTANDFTPVGEQSISFGNLAPGEASSTASIETTQNISTGTHYIDFNISYMTSTGKNITAHASSPLNIVVNKPDIQVNLVSANPPELYSGSNQTITLLVQNTGTGVAKDISLHLIGNNYIFPSSSATSLFIDTLDPGSSTTETATINANSTSHNSSVFPVYVKYYSSNYNTAYNSTEDVPISIVPSAVFTIKNMTSGAYTGGTYLPVTFKVENTGNEDAQQVSFTLESIYPITPVDANSYIENLTPGKNATITFYVSVDSNGAAGEYPVTVYEEWRQPNGNTNQQYSGSSSYYVDVGSSKSSKGGGIGSILTIVVVVAILGFMGYRFYNKRMKGSKPASRTDTKPKKG